MRLKSNVNHTFDGVFRKKGEVFDTDNVRKAYEWINTGWAKRLPSAPVEKKRKKRVPKNLETR